MDDPEYYLPDFERTISRKTLAKEDRDTQIEVMRLWFFENYEDPGERTPYESREGGYIWIRGGPYDAKWELRSEFEDDIPKDVIAELVSELNSISLEWGPAEEPGDYDEYIIDDIAEIAEYYLNFLGSIIDIKSLLKVTIKGSLENCFYRLLFANVITALETYLSDAFINSVIPEKELMRRFVENKHAFKSEKMPLSDVYKAAEGIEQRVKNHLADVVWHNLGRIKPMYRDVLCVSFPPEISDLTRAVLIRHDIVHRNGKSKTGEEILIKKSDVKTLVQKVEIFVQTIDLELSRARDNKWVNKDDSI